MIFAIKVTVIYLVKHIRCAMQLNIPFVNASLNPEEIFRIISKP